MRGRTFTTGVYSDRNQPWRFEMKKARWSDEFKMLVIVVVAILWIIGMYFFAEYLYQMCPTDPERWICNIV